MTRCTSRTRRRIRDRASVSFWNFLSRKSGRRISGLALLLLGVWLLESDAADWLPEPGAHRMREGQAWLGPVQRDLERDLPFWRERLTPQLGVAEIVAEAVALLPRVAVPPKRAEGYGREDWPHLLDPDGDSIDKRHEVLAAESQKPVRWSDPDCHAASRL